MSRRLLIALVAIPFLAVLIAVVTIIFLAAAPTPVAAVTSAPDDFVGDWEGLIAGQLTMVFHITQEDGAFSATLDVPQQNTAGLAMDSVTFEGETVRMTLDMIGGVYEGTLQDDGTIEGEWTQTAAPQPQVLNLSRQTDES